MTGHKILELAELVQRLEQHRARGEAIVLTNGCFDLFHLGHLETLEAARRHGDVLVAAINSDASVQRLKGIGRPVVPQNERARILAALGCVDYVVVFDEDTPRRLLDLFHPDVLVKGGATENIVGREMVEAYGGRVVQAGAVPGVSTTTRVRTLSASSSSTI